MLQVWEQGGDFSTVKGMAYIDENNCYVENPRRPLIKDVDSIPYPAWDLFTMEHHVLYQYPNASRSDRCMQMLSGRGCPFHCNFCYRMDSGFRPRSTQSIIDEMKELIDRFHVNYIAFDDELLMSSVARTKEIAQAIIDNKLNIKVARKVLSSLNFEIDECYNGQECLDKIKNGQKYDLILMDIMMPVMSGSTALQKLKEQENFNIPVIALTADTIAGAKEKYIEEGFKDYLAKPFSKEQIMEKLRVIFEEQETNKKRISWDDVPMVVITDKITEKKEN